MESLLEAVRAATANGASTEQKAAGAQACRTILAALDTEPGAPIVLPGMPAVSQPAARLSLDQVLDMMIAKLTVIASEHDKRPAPALPRPNGLRVPVTSAALPHVAPRSANRPVAGPKAPTRNPMRTP